MVVLVDYCWIFSMMDHHHHHPSSLLLSLVYLDLWLRSALAIIVDQIAYRKSLRMMFMLYNAEC